MNRGETNTNARLGEQCVYLQKMQIFSAQKSVFLLQIYGGLGIDYIK